MEPLEIVIKTGNLGTPAVKIGGAEYFQTDDQIKEQLLLWAKTLGSEKVRHLVDQVLESRSPVPSFMECLKPEQARPKEGEGPEFDFPQATQDGQWSYPQIVIALWVRFFAEEVHRPVELGFRGARYTADHYKFALP